MIDRPEMVELLLAMADTLSDQVVPACEGAPQHAARVVANLCRVLSREAEAGAANVELTTQDLRDLLGREADELGDLVAALDQALQSQAPESQAPESQAVEFDSADLHDALLANVERRLAIAKPSYK